MQLKPLPLLIALVSLACNDAGSSSKKNNPLHLHDSNPYSSVSEIPLPHGFKRMTHDSVSFAFYLINLELKKSKTVYLYNGQPKLNQQAQFAVLNVSVGKKDLQQCADAVMRLRAEYLFNQRKFDQIIFWDNAGTPYKFSEPYTRTHFFGYLNRVFGMCGSASLSRQLKRVENMNALQAGDVLIRGGFPGHAAIVMDVAVDEAGEKIYLLAQGYMPAQDIHIVRNPQNEALSPWYQVGGNNFIQTPEYIFTKNELKRWK